MNRNTVIVAGGTGERFGSKTPKQFLLLNNLPVLMHSINKFASLSNQLVVVLPSIFIQYWSNLCLEYSLNIPHLVAAGGSTRSASVLAGLNFLEGDGLVAIHDAARPLVSANLIESIFLHAERMGSAIPVIPVKDSLRKIDNDKSYAVERGNYKLVQTPQCFRMSELKTAFLNFPQQSFTDEAALMELAGFEISLVEGDPVNMKITNQLDLDLAQTLLNKIA
ncbi:MAG: 2-C-methyl-D-erythritol 4-phosphate cytidylyltransferase [Bacteroidia bacterium]|nr:2-C-methyl-D-erythritol 4-phosphate cytidylyltransferase [Bacteroidia bacterium]MCZ2277886.1 2-C-methyl-D-erythritol 4-phosphate cytidylyltransferase [Bacteroidia bacterium]